MTSEQTMVVHPVPEGVGEALEVLGDANPAETAALLIYSGVLTATGLDMSKLDPDVPYDDWRSLGVFFGVVHSGSRWALGDWINWGGRVFGEEAAQEVEPTLHERYDQAQRVTGLSPGRLANIASICGRIAWERRRAGVGFDVHAEIAKLEPGEQVVWLDKVVENGWNAKDLRNALNPPAEPAEPAEPGTTRVSKCERATEILFLIYHQATPTGHGSRSIPDETFAQITAHLGQE